MLSGIGAKDHTIFQNFDQAFIIITVVIVIIRKMRVSSSLSLLHHHCHHEHCRYFYAICWSLLVHSSAMTMAKHHPFIHCINCYLQDAELN